ncbi:hypothetical protein P691DRAFT_325280 [Macrolepiota fuliginosa MF-IS2]|uniref:Uncharacterized protein n=1 Tax=Macrolepiota fuliginosa MF-IS2 TaxID=1400762 RepID=A0A9P5X7Q9_9AGAR|nr:hypothetical protein P691DRAFT_325280 [Macrolepiota fuliginosa MF-IS2]
MLSKMSQAAWKVPHCKRALTKSSSEPPMLRVGIPHLIIAGRVLKKTLKCTKKWRNQTLLLQRRE